MDDDNAGNFSVTEKLCDLALYCLSAIAELLV